MQTLAQIKEILQARGLAPRKSLGQNFLIDHNLIRKLVDAANLQPGDRVLEIGPGTGTMTEELLDRGCRVVAGELDTGLGAFLADRFKDNPNFTLVAGDCLAGKRSISPALLAALGEGPFRLVSNLPYGAATPVMSVLLISHPECIGQYVTIQREVGDRLLAKPGSKDYGLLSVLASVAAKVRSIATLPPACFWPRPEVTSAMLSIEPLAQPLISPLPPFVDFVQRLFEQRRKQIGGVLGREGAWPPGIEPTARAEDLTVDQLIALFRSRGHAHPG